ncbi:hypothetical protein GEMRC1_003915 [Eukaryota sp. GEM-RC1]
MRLEPYLDRYNSSYIPHGDYLKFSKTVKEPEYHNDNGLILDPLADYFEGKRSRNWSDEDVLMFLEAWRQSPKDFDRISKALPGKSSFDVVEFYYLNKFKFKLSRKHRDRRISSVDINGSGTIHFKSDASDQSSKVESFMKLEGFDRNFEQLAI